MLKPQISLFVLLCAAGCEHAYYAKFYNNSGEPAVLRIEGKEYRIAPEQKAFVKYAKLHRTPWSGESWQMREAYFDIEADNRVWRYHKEWGPPESFEFPTVRLTDSFQIQPDRSIWYIGYYDPHVCPPYPPPAHEQPPGFPMKPIVSLPSE